LALAAAPLLIGSAMAQQAAWPDKMVKLVVPFPAGGPTDTASRIVGQKLGERLKQTVLIENKAGASGSIAACWPHPPCWRRTCTRRRATTR
jgi:tripartite-type tricarboxylate transporter receptor subunit TctC